MFLISTRQLTSVNNNGVVPTGAGGGGGEPPIINLSENSVARLARILEGRNENAGCTFISFKRCDPPKFTGLGDATATIQWISEMEKVIRVSGCRVDQAVGYAAQCFTDEAGFWWDVVEQ